VRYTRAYYPFVLTLGVGSSVPFAIAFAFCAMLVYSGVWWAIFGLPAVALIYWSYLGRRLWRMIGPVDARIGAVGKSIAPFVIGIWCVLAFMVVPVVDATIHGSKAQSEYTALAMAALIVSLTIVLWIIRRRRAGEPLSSRNPTR
jgi:hypothetical protein